MAPSLQVLSFINAVVSKLSMGVDTDNVAVIKFAQSAEVEIPLQRFSRSNSVARAVEALATVDEEARLANGIRILREQVFTGEDRTSAPNVAVIISHSNADYESSIDQAEQVKQEGTHLIAIGIDGANEALTQNIASYEQAHFTSNYEQLQYLVSGVVRDIAKHRKEDCSIPQAGVVHCHNTGYGGRQCFCYTKDHVRPMNGSTCENANECIEDNGGCQHMCIDTDGSFTCACHEGFALAADMHTCEVIAIEKLGERADGFLSRKLSESFSLVSFIMCIINIILIVVVVVTCKRRNTNGHLNSNLRQSAGMYTGGEAGIEAAKGATNKFDSISSKLSMVSSVSSHNNDTDVLHEYTNGALE
ncbi:hypothetical protein CAPTEDRAFT_224257 [Capitella teleta]|uniref:VWFA domain-containing protein n=1 Tax=Capitella teleta TaxID=283909 RepID=R7V485_CAPTE|nr:hypothetical protein CAPTEDRAFT_224257 [Capitella teleta]|eukprot:ELU11156.1 hypothetical protein CAPTEDRAFT_224257 [Capitella teleta]